MKGKIDEIVRPKILSNDHIVVFLNRPFLSITSIVIPFKEALDLSTSTSLHLNGRLKARILVAGVSGFLAVAHPQYFTPRSTSTMYSTVL